MDEPRWVTSGRGVAFVVIFGLGVAFAVAMLRSDTSAAAKIIGVTGVLFVIGGGLIRIWLASRPYGLGAWDQRKQSTVPPDHE